MATIGTKRLGRCTFCRLYTWVWVVTQTEQLCNVHMQWADEYEKRYLDHLEMEEA